MAKPRYYLTTAIAYPNGPPHIGHAYEVLATDAIARFMRLDGYDVCFLTGTDEHGIKMLQTAAKEGVSPRELADRNVAIFRKMVARMGCSNDDYIRTTEPRHYESSKAIWKRMADAGDIYLSKYSGWYSVRDEAYYDVSETRLDDKGQRLGPQGTPVEWVEEESYFFKLSAYQQKLIDLYERVPDFVLPRERLNEVASFVRGGLKDLSISRTTFTWGVPVPGDEKHVMYVWVDALTNYITGVGFPDTDSETFRRWWPADLHVIGKDIVRFHAVYWPGLLARLPVQPRREDVEVGRQRDRPVRARRRLRGRPAALLLPARGAVRPGRKLQPRGDRQPHQRRPRQRSRQPGAALAHHGGARVRWDLAGAGRLQRQRPGDPGAGGCDGRQGA